MTSSERTLMVGVSAALIASITVSIIALIFSKDEITKRKENPNLANFVGFHLEMMEKENYYNCGELISHDHIKQDLETMDIEKYGEREVELGRRLFNFAIDEILFVETNNICLAIEKVYLNKNPFL